MAKVAYLFASIFFLTTGIFCQAQSYSIHYRTPSGDSISATSLQIRDTFTTREEALKYIMELPDILHVKGYISSSVDSIQFDSAFARVILFTGLQYRWTSIHVRPEDGPLLEAVNFSGKDFEGPVDPGKLKEWEKRILRYLADNGHPFARIYLDSMRLDEGAVEARLRIEEGPLYHIDSIRVYGDAKVSNEFLQRYLDIPNGSYYSQKKLENISHRLSGITYLQEERPSDLTLLGSGSILNLYIKPRKTSQANVLIGILPNSDQLNGKKKLILTVDANVLLRNALGSGETIGLVWQQLQQQSPRLNLLFDRPYIFHTPLGLNFTLDMYKRDSAFLNINMNLGTNYHVDERQTTSLFLQRRSTIVSTVNTAAVIQNRKLPQEADVRSLNFGIGYEFINTDYRFNPRKGNELSLVSSAGTKRIRKNNLILKLEDPNDPSFNFELLYDTVKLRAYQFRMTAEAAHYIPLGGQSVLKVGLSGGIYQSASYFRNELFQIGGFHLLRGFDEGSQFVSQYAIGTAEYRLRMGQNSYFFVFADGGWGKHLLELKQDHTYLGTGIGLSIETKAGILNFAWALGERDDTGFNLRQSKIHIGFAGYF